MLNKLTWWLKQRKRSAPPPALDYPDTSASSHKATTAAARVDDALDKIVKQVVEMKELLGDQR